MKNESLKDEIKLIKLDLLNIQKESRTDYIQVATLIESMHEHIAYLYDKFELKFPEKKKCTKCEGHGTVYISPISDCGQSNKCGFCNGKGFNYK